MKKLAGWLIGIVATLVLLSLITRALRDAAFANAPPATPETYVGDVAVPAGLLQGYSRMTRAYIGNVLYVTLTLREPPPPSVPPPLDSMRGLGCEVPVVQGDEVVVGINAPDGANVSQLAVRPQDCR